MAPTGTIGLVMDCDTTGIEPDFALVKVQKLAGGGYFKIINQSVPGALERSGLSKFTNRRDRELCRGPRQHRQRTGDQSHVADRCMGSVPQSLIKSKQRSGLLLISGLCSTNGP